ncbi:MAG: DUF5797 family protein [Halobacteriaceae archaeon]
MGLSDEARKRLADVVELQPTKNAELQERWDMDSGSEVHQYLERELSAYYYRDENSLVRATAEGVKLVGGDPEEAAREGPIEVTDLESKVVAVLAGPDERSESVVSVLHALREAYDVDPDPEAVRKALRSLERKGVVRVVHRTVPTFRLAVDRDAVELTVA